MKTKTALRQTKSSLLFLGLAVPAMWGLFAYSRDGLFAAIAGFMTLYLIVDIIIVIRIVRRARTHPESLEEKVKL